MPKGSSQVKSEGKSGSGSNRGRGRPGGSRRGRRKNAETFNLYIYKVLKQVHPDFGMSKKAMAIMNSFVLDTFDRIATEASKLVQYSSRQTMDLRAVASATKLVLPGELSKHAQSEAQRACNKYAQQIIKN